MWLGAHSIRCREDSISEAYTFFGLVRNAYLEQLQVEQALAIVYENEGLAAMEYNDEKVIMAGILNDYYIFLFGDARGSDVFTGLPSISSMRIKEEMGSIRLL